MKTRSAVGSAGAGVSILIAAVTLVTLFLNRDYRPGVIGAAIWFALGIGYFAFYGSKRLVLAPEEKFAEEVRSAEWARTATP